MRRWPSLLLPALLITLVSLGSARPANAVGARLYKSGPIQITADGRFVWLVNTDNDSVSRVETATNNLREFPLAGAGRHDPRGLAVKDDGSEVWVACHDADHVHVLNGSDGSEITLIDLPYGTGPYSVALSPPTGFGGQLHALVTGYRGDRLVALDAMSRTVLKVLEPVYISPFGIAFVDDGSAWVTHLFADGEHPRRSRVDFSDPLNPTVTTKLRIGAVHPQNSQQSAPRPAEGGYLTTRGHPAQVPMGQDPGSSSTGRLWILFQYQNIHETQYSPDSTIQSTIRKIDVDTKIFADGTNFPGNPEHPAKVIVSAVEVHDPVNGNRNPPPYDGTGWNAEVSGAVDVGFSADGRVAYVLHEQSEDVLVMPTNTDPIKPAAAPPLVEIPVGKRPMGMVLSPTTDLAYVTNQLSRSVTVLDLSNNSRVTDLPATPVTGEPWTPSRLRGAQIFFSSNEDEISLNRKVSCASCHVNGEHDGRGWDFQHLPGNHGPRVTQTLAGLGLTYGRGGTDPATGWGQLHSSGDRDEVQDFEHTFQGVQMGGLGFLGNNVNPELGAPNAGLSPDLDALAEYVLSIPLPPRSPHRQADGSLTDAARRGATFFLGADPTKPADGQCATCHVPETGFVDHQFHDVGQRRKNGENELNNRTPANHVNTQTLLGTFATPPYEGVATWAEDMLGALLDIKGRTGHGTIGNLTNRQVRDLEEFILSLDGNTTAAEVRAAVDDQPPRIVRVSPTSPSRLEVWFDESVDRASAENVAAWDVRDAASGTPVTITGVTLDVRNHDRVTLSLDRLEIGCQPITYEVTPVGPINDLADWATGGTANALVGGAPVSFVMDGQLTITLGDTGYENLTVPVHDAATIPNLRAWSHGSLWLIPNGNNPGTGFVRFEWRDAFANATGITNSADILDVSITIHPDFGDAQDIEARRVLQAWWDHRRGDFTNNPQDPVSGHGGPTWNESEDNVRGWNQGNARATAAGVDGDDPADWFGTEDTANVVDATVTMPAINEPVVLRDAQPGDRMTDAYRFWFDNPSVDYGHALRLLPGSALDARHYPVEKPLTTQGPTLTITYQLPPTVGVPGEISAPASASPLWVAKDPAGLAFSFEDVGIDADTYNVYEGTIGTWYSHGGPGCALAPVRQAGRADLTWMPNTGNRYFLVTGTGSCAEGPGGRDSFLTDRDPSQLGCPP